MPVESRSNCVTSFMCNLSLRFVPSDLVITVSLPLTSKLPAIFPTIQLTTTLISPRTVPTMNLSPPTDSSPTPCIAPSKLMSPSVSNTFLLASCEQVVPSLTILYRLFVTKSDPIIMTLQSLDVATKLLLFTLKLLVSVVLSTTKPPAPHTFPIPVATMKLPLFTDKSPALRIVPCTLTSAWCATTRQLMPPLLSFTFKVASREQVVSVDSVAVVTTTSLPLTLKSSVISVVLPATKPPAPFTFPIHAPIM